MRARLDLLALAAAAITAVMLVIYLVLTMGESGEPAVWVIGLLLIGALGAGYAVRRHAAGRRGALILATVALAVVGLLGILTIGLPLLVAAALCVVAATRS